MINRHSDKASAAARGYHASARPAPSARWNPARRKGKDQSRKRPEPVEQSLRLGGRNPRPLSSGHAFVPARRRVSVSPKRADICARLRRAWRRPLPSDPKPRATGRGEAKRPALAGVLLFGRHRQERFRRVAVALALERLSPGQIAPPATFHPDIAQKIAEGLLGQRVVFMTHSHRPCRIRLGSPRAAAWQVARRWRWYCAPAAAAIARTASAPHSPSGPRRRRTAASVVRSSGAPVARAGGAVGGPLSPFRGGAPAAWLSSTRGAPGALGCCAGRTRRNGCRARPRPADRAVPAHSAEPAIERSRRRHRARLRGRRQPAFEPKLLQRYSVSSCMRLINCWFSCLDKVSWR